MTLKAELAQGLQVMGITTTCEIRSKLLAYLALIQKWNRVYNLTSVRDPAGMLTHHVLDSVAVAPHVHGSTVLDVGSGAGLPGIPIALVLPQMQVTLLDSNQKKSTFQQQAVIELGLNNVEVVNARTQSWDTRRVFDTLLSRAYAEIADFVAAAARLCAPGGVLAAMKGAYPTAELERIPAGYAVEQVIPLAIPGLAAARHLVMVKRVASPT
ncbi:MAG: 16S rRNA (guanine(527)-N(7))-methyltransferase RsmG [Pseudomonadota bacterium]